jgi:hypothetical protein
MEVKKLLFLLVFIVVITGVIVIRNTVSDKTQTLGYKNVSIKYDFLQKNIDERLSKSDSEEIKKILNNRSLFSDNPSCGFSKDISFQFNEGDIIYSIARDTCPIFKDEKTGKYFQISEKERNKINKILEKYGASFPAL